MDAYDGGMAAVVVPPNTWTELDTDKGHIEFHHTAPHNLLVEVDRETGEIRAYRRQMPGQKDSAL